MIYAMTGVEKPYKLFTGSDVRACIQFLYITSFINLAISIFIVIKIVFRYYIMYV